MFLFWNAYKMKGVFRAAKRTPQEIGLNVKTEKGTSIIFHSVSYCFTKRLNKWEHQRLHVFFLDGFLVRFTKFFGFFLSIPWLGRTG